MGAVAKARRNLRRAEAGYRPIVLRHTYRVLYFKGWNGEGGARIQGGTLDQCLSNLCRAFGDSVSVRQNGRHYDVLGAGLRVVARLEVSVERVAR